MKREFIHKLARDENEYLNELMYRVGVEAGRLGYGGGDLAEIQRRIEAECPGAVAEIKSYVAASEGLAVGHGEFSRRQAERKRRRESMAALRVVIAARRRQVFVNRNRT